MKRIVIYSAMTLACLGLQLAGPGEALAGPAEAVREYTHQGQGALQQSDFSSAVFFFLGALALDPADDAARQYLQDPKLRRGLNGADQQQSVNGLMEMADFMQFLLSRIEFYQRQNQEGISHLRPWVGQAGLTGGALDQLEKRASEPALAGAEQLQMPVLVSTTEIPPLELIRSAMQKQKKQLVFALAEQRNINREIKALQIKNDQALRAQSTSPAPIVTVIPDDSAALAEELRQKEQRIADQDRSIEEIRQQLGGVSQKFDMLEQQLGRTEQQVVELTRKIAGMSLEIYEKDTLLANRANQIDDLEFQLQDAQERLKLIQQLMAEKDVRIQDLEARLPSAEQMAAAVVENGKAAEDVEMRVAALNAKYDALREVLTQKDQQLAALRQELELERTAPAPVAPADPPRDDEQIRQLMAILTIYKDRLGETCRLLRDRDERLQKLEDQLQAVEGLFNRDVPPGPSAVIPPEPDADADPSPFDYPAPHELSVRDKVPLNQLGVLERVKQESSAAATRMLMSPGLPTFNP